MIGKKEIFNFRQLVNQFVIIADDDKNLNAVATVFPHQTRDNAILTYGFIHPERGLMFEVLAMARLTQTGIEEADCRIDIREAKKDTSFIIDYNSISGVLVEFKPDMSWPVLEDFDNKIRIAHTRDLQTAQEIRDMREIKKVDKYRHESFPDDLAVVFIGKLPKPETIWCKGFLSDDGEMKGRLMNEPWDSSLGLHNGDVVEIEVLTLDGKTDLFALLDDLNVSKKDDEINGLSEIKQILQENPEICVNSAKFDQLLKKCTLDERLKDNLLLCIEDDIVDAILNAESYTDSDISRWKTQLERDCNLSRERATEAVLWWIQILEIDESGRIERKKRYIQAKNPLISNEVVEEAVKPQDPRKKIDVLAGLDAQLKDLIQDETKSSDVIDVEFKEVPDPLSNLQSQLNELLEKKESIKEENLLKKETRSFWPLMELIEKADFQFPIPIQARDWEEDKYLEIETIRGDMVYGSIYKDGKYIDMERLPLKSSMRYALYDK